MEIPLKAAISGQVPVVIATNHGGVKSTNKSAWSKRSPFTVYDPSGAQMSVWKELSKRAKKAINDGITGYTEVQLSTDTKRKDGKKGQTVWLVGGAIHVAKGGAINVSSDLKRGKHYRAFQRWSYDATNDTLKAVTPMAVITS